MTQLLLKERILYHGNGLTWTRFYEVSKEYFSPSFLSSSLLSSFLPSSLSSLSTDPSILILLTQGLHCAVPFPTPISMWTCSLLRELETPPKNWKVQSLPRLLSLQEEILYKSRKAFPESGIPRESQRVPSPWCLATLLQETFSQVS